MARCETCNKFTSLTSADPEVDDLELADGNISCSIRLCRVCADCDAEMKEAHFDLDEPVVKFCKCETPAIKLDDTIMVDCENTEESGGRYKKSYFGFDLTVALLCETCGLKGSFTCQDKTAAGDMDPV